MTTIASSSVAMLVGGLPSTRRALSPRPIPRSMRPPEISSRTARVEAVTLGSRVAGLVTQVPSRIRSVACARSARRTYGSRHRTWLSKSQPYENPLASARRASSTSWSYRCSGLSVNPKSIPEGGLRPDEVAVCVGSPIAEKLPGLADLVDLVEVQVADEQLLLVRVADLAHKLAPWVAEIGLPVEIVVAEGLDPDPVDGAHVVAVGE